MEKYATKLRKIFQICKSRGKNFEKMGEKSEKCSQRGYFVNNSTSLVSVYLPGWCRSGSGEGTKFLTHILQRVPAMINRVINNQPAVVRGFCPFVRVDRLFAFGRVMYIAQGLMLLMWRVITVLSFWNNSAICCCVSHTVSSATCIPIVPY